MFSLHLQSKDSFKKPDDMKKILLTTLIMFIALSVYAQTGASAYICDYSGTPTAMLQMVRWFRNFLALMVDM